MGKNPILSLPLSAVMRPQYALPLQHVHQIYTVGNLLGAWRSPRVQRHIEQIFDSPQQARHAVMVCCSWLGLPTGIHSAPDSAWWREDATHSATTV